MFSVQQHLEGAQPAPHRVRLSSDRRIRRKPSPSVLGRQTHHWNAPFAPIARGAGRPKRALEWHYPRREELDSVAPTLLLVSYIRTPIELDGGNWS